MRDDAARERERLAGEVGRPPRARARAQQLVALERFVEHGAIVAQEHPDGLLGERVGGDRCARRQPGLERVAEAVDEARTEQVGVDVVEQLRVDECDAWRRQVGVRAQLAAGVVVGHDARAVGLAAAARQRGDRDDRQDRVDEQVARAATREVVGERARPGCGCGGGDRLRSVDHAAAADGDDHVDPAGAREHRTGVDHGDAGIGTDALEQLELEPGADERGLDASKQARLARVAFTDDHERAAPERRGPVSDAVGEVAADDHVGGRARVELGDTGVAGRGSHQVVRRPQNHSLSGDSSSRRRNGAAATSMPSCSDATTSSSSAPLAASSASSISKPLNT